MTGTIKAINERGFGFITTGVVGDKDIFFHTSDLADGLVFGEHLRGQRVDFEVIGGPKGPAAKNVRAA